MKTKVIITLLIAGFMTASAQTNYTAISNLNRPSSGESVFFGNESGIIKWGVAFATSNTVTALSAVSLSLDGFFTEPQVNPNSALGTIQVAIYSDASSLPGTDLVDLHGNNRPTSPGIYTYTNSSPLILSTNHVYWLVAASTDSVSIAAYFWNTTTSTTVDPGSVWKLAGASTFSSGSWSTVSSMYPQFSVTVSPSAPALAISEVIALTYPATEFPFALQQNTNLATTNWVAVTNAAQVLVTNLNQTEYVVPITGSDMFYRLYLQ